MILVYIIDATAVLAAIGGIILLLLGGCGVADLSRYCVEHPAVLIGIPAAIIFLKYLATTIHFLSKKGISRSRKTAFAIMWILLRSYGEAAHLGTCVFLYCMSIVGACCRGRTVSVDVLGTHFAGAALADRDHIKGQNCARWQTEKAVRKCEPHSQFNKRNWRNGTAFFTQWKRMRLEYILNIFMG